MLDLALLQISLKAVEEPSQSSIHAKLHHFNKFVTFIKMAQKNQLFTNPEDHFKHQIITIVTSLLSHLHSLLQTVKSLTSV